MTAVAPYTADMLDKVLPYPNFWHVTNYARDEDPATGQVMTFPVPMEFGLTTIERRSTRPSVSASAAHSRASTTAAMPSP
jgi:hypothetical protein